MPTGATLRSRRKATAFAACAKIEVTNGSERKKIKSASASPWMPADFDYHDVAVALECSGCRIA